VTTTPQTQRNPRALPPRIIHLPHSVLSLAAMNAAIETDDATSPL
jgi:hypothetical protein